MLAYYKSKEEVIGVGLRARPQDAIVLTPLGCELEKSIGYINTHYKNIDVENAIVMPNHIIRNQTNFENHWNYIEYNALKEYE